MSGTKAVAESTGSICARFKHNDVEYDLVSQARFISRLERVDSVWKMLSLEAIYERDAIHPVFPGAGEPISDIGDGRASYKCLSWVLAQNGFAVDQNLPGSDKPGSADAMMKANFDWLDQE